MTNTQGLRGQVAGQTAISSVQATGSGLAYRGYNVVDLASKAQFEEVAFLLLKGHLPNKGELTAFKSRLAANRGLPAVLRTVLELIPASAHPMDVLRTGCSVLGNLETETHFSAQQAAAERIIALLPAIICYWYRYTHDGVRIDTALADDSLASHFLHMLRGSQPAELDVKVMNSSLILYAEHEFNASTFAARVCASTLTDLHSAITAAIGTLRGPLHGGANEAAMAMLAQWHTPDEAEQALLAMLAQKEKVMGFGHAVYKTKDPRNAIIKAWAKKLSEAAGDRHLYSVCERVEAVMWREKKLFANADFYHASAYHFLAIPTLMFTPIFVLSRVTGWAAHIMEQRAHNRIIRPTADYIGPPPQAWLPLSKR